MKTSRLLCALVVAALPAADLEAGVIDYSATFDAVTDNLFLAGGGSGSHWTYLLLSGPTPELTGTLQSGQQLRVTYSAPAGEQINILPKPVSADSLLVAAQLWSESPLGSPFIDTSGASYSLSGFAGAAPVVSSFQFTEAAAEKFRAGIHFSTGGFSFQSIEMVFDIPAGYDRTFMNHVPSDVVLVVIANWSADIFDPGPLATITRAASLAPEPSTVALATLAMTTLAIARRRRQA